MQADVWQLQRMVEDNGSVTPELARSIAACKFEPHEIERYSELLTIGSERPLDETERSELDALLNANDALILLIVKARKLPTN